MTAFVLVYCGKVVQPVADAEFPVHESLTWVDVSNVDPQPQYGWNAVETDGKWSFSAPS